MLPLRTRQDASERLEQAPPQMPVQLHQLRRCFLLLTRILELVDRELDDERLALVVKRVERDAARRRGCPLAIEVLEHGGHSHCSLRGALTGETLRRVVEREALPFSVGIAAAELIEDREHSGFDVDRVFAAETKAPRPPDGALEVAVESAGL
jgi:hypothetical protein